MRLLKIGAMQQQARLIYPRDGLVSHWRLDENPAIHGTVIQDSSGVNNGTLITNEGSTNKSSEGKISNALNFDGVDDYVNVPHADNLVSNQLSITFWIYRNSWVRYQGYVAKYYIATTADQRSWAVFAGLDRAQGHMAFVSSADGTSGTSIKTDGGFMVNSEWIHVGITYDAGQIVFYKNGLFYSSGVGALQLYNNTLTPLEIGRYDAPGGAYHNGKIDDILIYNRVLTQPEIQKIYNIAP